METIKMQPTLVIGMGGTGIKTLLKLKAIMFEKAPEILESGKLALLGIDTEPWNRDKHGRYGGVELAHNKEFLPMGLNVSIDVWINRVFAGLKENPGENVGIAPHWPVVDGMCYTTGLGAITMGAAQNRLVGRAAVFLEAAMLIRRLSPIIGSLAKHKSDLAELNIHFVASLAGGTGSGMIFDAPYIVKIICKNLELGCKTYGHLLTGNCFINDMPGVGPQNRVRANTWNALKELDHWNRLFISDPQTAHWLVRYSEACGTCQYGVGTDVARQRPLDITFLYNNVNTADLTVATREPLCEVIAKGISHSMMAGAGCWEDGGFFRSAAPMAPSVNSMQDYTALSSRGKCKCYSAMGVATIELPIERLVNYMSLQWAGQLALDKCAADAQGDENNYDIKKWEEFGGLLEKVFTLQFPTWRIVDDKWEECDEATLREQWSVLAEEYGMENLDLDAERHIAERILDDYDNRIVAAKRYYNDCREEEEGHERRQKTQAQEKLKEIKQGIKGYVTGVMEGDRSPDALAFAIPLVFRALQRMDQLLSEIQGSIQSNEARLATACIVDNRLKDSPFFGRSRERQVKGWTTDNDEYWIQKAEGDRVLTLRISLREITEHMEELRAAVLQADTSVESFAKDCSVEAEMQVQDAICEEHHMVTCEYLIKPDEYPEFIKQFNCEDEKEGIFASIGGRADKELKMSALEALGSQKKRQRDKATNIWYEECRNAAKHQLAKYKLADHIAKIIEEDGGDDRLRGMLRSLSKKAGPWLQHNITKTGIHPTDELQTDQYFIYPQGADEIKKTFLRMKEEGEFSGATVRSHAIMSDPDDSIVCLNVAHRYSLDTLDFLEQDRAAEQSMMEYEKDHPVLRTIFKDSISRKITPKIFISYRREDCQGSADYLHSLLEDHFGAGNVFFDMDSIRPGSNYLEKLNEEVSQCNVLLALIGKRWVTAENKDRLFDEKDFVRKEITSAMDQGITVIPLLVERAEMPTKEMLPDALHKFCDQQAAQVRPSPDFRKDAAKLINELVHVELPMEYADPLEDRPTA